MEISYDQALIARESEIHSSPSPYACPQAFMHGRTREADLFRGGVTSHLQLVAVMTTAQADPLSHDPLRQCSPPEKLHLRFRRTQTVDCTDRNPAVHLCATCNDIHQQDLCWTAHLFAATQGHTTEAYSVQFSPEERCVDKISWTSTENL